MRILTGEQEIEALTYLDNCRDAAKKATCERSKCGSIIVSLDNNIIGVGYNTPPSNFETQRRCSIKKDSYDLKVTDKTCCIHAEQRAIFSALRNDKINIYGSTLYFVRLDSEGNITKSGDPYCTICSKMALDIGIAEFVLWREEGICVYPTEEYNDLSFKYCNK